MSVLDALLSKPEQRLLAWVLLRVPQDFGTLELLRQMACGRGAGSAVLNRWVGAGLLCERRVGNQRRISANTASLLFPELRQLLLKTVGLAEPLAQALLPLVGRLEDAFVFGSVAAGTDRAASDIDLAIVGDISHFDVAPLLDEAQNRWGRPLHLSLYSPQEWASDDPILSAIRSGPRIDLMEAMRAKAGNV